MLQKFSFDEDTGIMLYLTDRSNVIVMAYEAHRSQYGFGGTVRSDEAETKYGFGLNALFVGFTGTPVEATDKNTSAVFGDYIDIYDMTQAVEEGATVKIHYESRIIPLDLPEGLDLDAEYEEITEDQEQTVKEKMNSK